MGLNDISNLLNDPILQILLIVFFFLIVLCLAIIIYSKYIEKKYDESDENNQKGEDSLKTSQVSDSKNDSHNKNKSSSKKGKQFAKRSRHTIRNDNDTLTEQNDSGEDGNAPLESRESEFDSSPESREPEFDSPSERPDEKEETSSSEDNSERATMDTPPKTEKLFAMITVKNGLFVEADSCDAIYYKAWIEEGKMLFEFVNNERTKKAINNRSILIEPFCFKMDNSISPDEADMIETKEPGILSDDYTVEEKAKIIYK